MTVSTLVVPSMYADHHVSAVRRALEQLGGVQEIHASASFKEVTIKHGKEVTEQALADALTKAGYPVGQEESPEEEPSCFGDPGWYECAPRCIRTDEADLAMSGDFRKY